MIEHIAVDLLEYAKKKNAKTYLEVASGLEKKFINKKLS